MAKRILLVLALGCFGGGLARSCVDDSQNLVQKALAVRPATQKQTPEERKAEPVTRKNLRELISEVLKKVPGFPPMLISAAQDAIVPKIMESRRKSSSLQRRLVDGILGIDLLGMATANLTTKLEGLSAVMANAGVDNISAGLHNASIILPPVLNSKRELMNITWVLAEEFTRQLDSALQKFGQDVKPNVEEFSREAINITSQYLSDIWPLIQKLEMPTNAAINASIAELQQHWRTKEEFKKLRSALREIFGMQLQTVWKELYDEDRV